MKRLLLLILTLCFSAVFQITCQVPDTCATERFKAKAVKGVVDLKNHDFNAHPIVSLTGQWHFFWKSFVKSSEIDFENLANKGGWIDVPGQWNKHTGDGKTPGGHGYGTIALRVVLGAQSQHFAISIREILTNYTLFINGKRVHSVGTVGKSLSESTPEYRPVIIDLDPGQEVLDILIHISNFHHRMGGVWSNITIGRKSDLHDAASYRLVINMFMVGSIIVMGFYHLCLYGLRRRYTATLYLGIFCCLIALRAMVTNERYLHTLVTGLPWEVLLKIEYLGFYLAVPVFSKFIAVLFPAEFSKKILKSVIVISTVFSSLVLFCPARIYSYTVLSYQIFTLFVGAYLVVVFIQAVKDRREGVWALIIGFSALFACVINDFLYSNGVIKTAYVVQAGMFVFIFTQAFILSLRFSRTYHQVESKSLELTREITSRKKLEISLLESHDQFKSSRIALILGLAKLAEYRDMETGSHLERMREYVRIIATDLSKTTAYNDYITLDYIEDIFQSAILHDIGKVGIRDDILLKPGKLTGPEFKIMKTHTLIGGDALTAVSEKVRLRSFLTLGKDIAYYHHEKWNGTGYPKGLKGKQIPLSARITAVADVYDALTSERPYKKAFTHETAVAIIKKDSGTHFDPDIAAAFLRQAGRINQVRENFKETH